MLHCSPRTAALLLCILPLASVSAQQSPDVKNEALYQKAVSALSAIGYPSVKEARYVNFSQYRGSHSSYGGDEKEVLQGTGFITKKDAEGKSLYISLDGRVLFVSKTGKNEPNDPYEERYDFSKAKDVDLKKDITAQLEQLGKPNFRQQIIERIEYSPEIILKYFLLGCLAYENGEKQQGAAMIAEVLKLSDSSTMLDMLISVMADAQLAKAFQNFNKHTDWKLYQQDVEKVCEKYARGWSKYPAAKMLIEHIEHRSKITEIIKLIKSSNQYPSNNWIIQPGGRGEFGEDGLDVFIVMAGMLDLNILIKPDKNGRSSHHYSSYGGFSNGDYDVEYLYSQLPKPSNIAEILSQWVRGGVPSLDSRRDLSNEELKNAAIEWWKNNKSKSRLELAKVMLEAAEPHKVSNLLSLFVNEKDPEFRALFEQHVLEAEDPSNMSYLVDNYVRLHKQEAKVFLKKYLENYQQYTEQQSARGNGDYYQKRFERAKEDLELLLENVDLPKLIALLTRKDITNEVLKKNVRKIQKSSTIDERWSDKIRPQLISIAADKPLSQVGIVLELFKDQGDHDVFGEPIEESVELVFSDEEKADWKKLMGLPVIPIESYSAVNYLSGGLIVKKIICNYISPGILNSVNIWNSVSEDEENELLTKYIDGYFNGEVKALDPLFEITTDEQAEKLENMLNELAPKELTTKFYSLPVGERIALLARKRDNQSAKEWYNNLKGYFVGMDSSYFNSRIKAKKEIHNLYNSKFRGLKYDAKGLSRMANFLLENENEFAGSIVSFWDAHKYSVGITTSILDEDDSSYYLNWIPKAFNTQVEEFVKSDAEASLAITFVHFDTSSGQNVPSGAFRVDKGENLESATEKLTEFIKKSSEVEGQDPYICFYLMTKEKMDKDANEKVKAEEAKAQEELEQKNLEDLKNLLKLK